MKTVPFFGFALVSLALLVDGKSWQPRSALHHSVRMKDFVNSRALPIVSPQGGAGASGSSGSSSATSSSSSSATPSSETDDDSSSSEDVARGGHASVKAGQEAEEEQQTGETIATDTVVPEIAMTADDDADASVDAAVSENITSINVDVLSPADKKSLSRKEKKERKAKLSSSKIAKKLKNRNHINIRRKVMHAGFGLFFSMLNWVVPKSQFLPGMVILTSGALVVELLRYRPGWQWINEVSYKLVGSGIRKHEMEGKFTGIFYFWSGVTLTAALFSKPCATLGIMQLAIADPSASYFGTKTKHVYWSRIEKGLGGIGRNKGFLGFLGGAIFCVPFNYRMLSCAKFVSPPTKATIALASLGLGLAGAFADLAVPTPVVTLPKRIWGRRVPPFHLDDNFVVPIFSAFACQEMFQALGWSHMELARFVWF